MLATHICKTTQVFWLLIHSEIIRKYFNRWVVFKHRLYILIPNRVGSSFQIFYGGGYPPQSLKLVKLWINLIMVMIIMTFWTNSEGGSATLAKPSRSMPDSNVFRMTSRFSPCILEDSHLVAHFSQLKNKWLINQQYITWNQSFKFTKSRELRMRFWKVDSIREVHIYYHSHKLCITLNWKKKRFVILEYLTDDISSSIVI